MTTLGKLKTTWRDKNITLKYKTDFHAHCPPPPPPPNLPLYMHPHRTATEKDTSDGKWDATVTSLASHTRTMSQTEWCTVWSTTLALMMTSSQQWRTGNSNSSATWQDLVALQRPFPREQWRSRERGRQRKECRGMDRETTCRVPSNGTQPQQMKKTCAQLVRTAPQQLHRKLRQQAKPANVKMVVSNIRCDTWIWPVHSRCLSSGL